MLTLSLANPLSVPNTIQIYLHCYPQPSPPAAKAMFRSTLLRQQPAMLAAAMRPAMVRPAAALPSLIRRQPLGTIPQPPGGIVGGVNDPVAVPPADRSHGSYHWSFERLIVLGMVPLAMTPLVGGSLTPVLDATLGSLILMHSHLGFQSCIIDYIPKRVYGRWHSAAMYFLYAGSATALYGVYQMETNDIGLTLALSEIWNA